MEHRQNKEVINIHVDWENGTWRLMTRIERELYINFALYLHNR